MKKLIFTLLFLTHSLLAEQITVAVAANVSYAMDALKEQFSKDNPSIEVRVVLGSSGKLSTQIRNGAPYGIFISANMNYPQALYKDALASYPPQVYAQGSLAYFSLKPRDFSQGIELLQDSNIHKIALANAKTAPYGKATKQALENAGLYKSLKPKFIYAESISQTLSYVLVAADMGIVAKSSLYSAKMKAYKEDVNWKELDNKLYEPIQQGIVLLKQNENTLEYKAFYDFILSEKGQKIFKDYGYTF